MDDASGTTERHGRSLERISIGYLDKLVLTNSPDPHRTVEFDMKVQPQYLREIPVDSVAGIARPTCWATSSSISPRAAPPRPFGRRGIEDLAGAGHSGADGRKRQPSNRSGHCEPVGRVLAASRRAGQNRQVRQGRRIYDPHEKPRFEGRS